MKIRWNETPEEEERQSALWWKAQPRWAKGIYYLLTPAVFLWALRHVDGSKADRYDLLFFGAFILLVIGLHARKLPVRRRGELPPRE